MQTANAFAAAAAPIAGSQPSAQARPEPSTACGWFDSSYELGRGLHVHELDDDVAPLWRWVAFGQPDLGMITALQPPAHAPCLLV